MGTSACKLLLVAEDGSILNTVTKEYPLSFPHPGWSEQRPEDWRDAVVSGIPKLLQGFDAEQVAGIGTGGQMHGIVALDAQDNVIRPAILWNDGRTSKEVDYLNNVVGKDKLSALTANIAFAGFTAPKLLWMRENEPESFKKIAKIMLPKVSKRHSSQRCKVADKDKLTSQANVWCFLMDCSVVKTGQFFDYQRGAQP